MRRAFGHAAVTSDEDNAVDRAFSASGRLLKKPQLLGDEERGARRSVSYAAVTSDEGNDVDGAFSAAC